MPNPTDDPTGGATRIILVGMMGSGKTTVGRYLASRLGTDFADSDEEIERQTGKSVQELFGTGGEREFRRTESAMLASLLGPGGPRVIAAGGGAVLEDANRQLMRREATVVWLRTTVGTLSDRVGTGEGRPLLSGGAADKLADIAGARETLYESVADIVTDTDGFLPIRWRTPCWEQSPEPPRADRDASVRTLLRIGRHVVKTIPVDLGNRSYDVVVGGGALDSLHRLIPSGAKRAIVVTQAGIPVQVDLGIPFTVAILPGGEQAKSFVNVESLCRQFAQASLSRTDVVVAVGGGVTTDVAGLASALYHRGVEYVNVPTTLLGQVDAAIGGKTGVNLPEGKNLMGAFWQPSAVVCDTDTLASLGAREMASGRGEMAKYAFLGDEPPGTALLDLPIDEQVARCVELKVKVVTSDERESGSRALLNYGHTLAHTLEAVSFGESGGFDLRHGEAVAIGLVFAAELARRCGRIDEERVDLHRRVVRGFGLSYDLPPGASATELVSLMARDKKAHGDLTFVLDGPRGVELVTGVDPSEVTDTLVQMGSER